MILNELHDAGCQALAQTLPVMPYLRQLCLSHTQLTDSHLEILLKALKVHFCCDALLLS